MPAVGQLTMIPKTPAKAELYRQRESDIEAAVRGDPISEEAAQFSGGSMLTRLAPVVPLGGLHKGVDLRVRPFRTFAEDEEPRWELGLDGKSRLHLKTKCKTIEEWEQAFLHIAVECPSKEQGRVLLSFHAWFKLRISQFGFAVMLEFYDFLMKLVADSRADMSEHRVNTVWQEFQLLKSREGTDIYTPSSRVSPNPKAPKLPRVEPAPKPAALTKPPKFKGQCCWNFNKVTGCSTPHCPPPRALLPVPTDCPESYDIGYLELFTVFWAIVLWGKYITGKTVHDVRLRPVYISSEDNIYADLLSRDRVEDFRVRFEADKQRLVWIEDRDDWMLIPTLWHPLDVQLGPFTVDCCVSENGANSFCRVGWTKVDDARVMDFSGHNAWGNLPFSDFIDIVRNFLRCKRRVQSGTSLSWCREEFLDTLRARTVTLQSECFALNTQIAYSTGVRSWVSFCISGRARGFLDKMLPAEDVVLADWVVYMVTERAVKPDTAKKYTSGVRALHVQL
eukprot:gene34085-biopygen11110